MSGLYFSKLELLSDILVGCARPSGTDLIGDVYTLKASAQLRCPGGRRAVGNHDPVSLKGMPVSVKDCRAQPLRSPALQSSIDMAVEVLGDNDSSAPGRTIKNLPGGSCSTNRQDFMRDAFEAKTKDVG